MQLLDLRFPIPTGFHIGQCRPTFVNFLSSGTRFCNRREPMGPSKIPKIQKADEPASTASSCQTQHTKDPEALLMRKWTMAARFSKITPLTPTPFDPVERLIYRPGKHGVPYLATETSQQNSRERQFWIRCFDGVCGN